MNMSVSPTSQDQKTKANGSAVQIRWLAFGLSVTGTVLLTANFYFIRELLTILGALAILFVVGTAGLVLLVVIQEIGKWAALRLGAATNLTVFSRRSVIVGELARFAVSKEVVEKSEM